MKDNVQSITAMVIDDHTLFREGLRAMLCPRESIETVHEASSIEEALPILRQNRIDIVLLDVTLPGESGIAAIPEIRSVSSSTKVVIITMHTGAQTVRSALDAGADGFLGKDVSLSELVHAVSVVSSGERYIMDGIEVSRPERGEQSLWSRYQRLSPREREVFALLADGKRPREIAVRLGMAKKTAESHRYNVLNKLEIENAGELAQAAFDLGIPRL